jgi:hypothetical protein
MRPYLSEENMARFMNRDEFKKYILRKLGGGINRIIPTQMTMDQLDDCIDDAIDKFQRYHYDGSRKRTMIIQKTDQRQTEYDLPESVLAVNRILHGRYTYFNTGGTGSSGAYEDYLLYGRRQGGLSTRTRDGQIITPYYIQEQSFNTFTDVYLPDPEYTFSSVTKRLIVQSPVDRRNYFENQNALYLEIVEAITEDVAPDMYDHEWLKEYTIAITGIQWATNITRFSNVALPGQAVSNGEKMLARYEIQKDKLEEELKSSGTVPKIFVT